MEADYTYFGIELQTMINETNIDLGYALKQDPDDSFGMKQYYTDRLEVLEAIKKELARLKTLEK